MNFLEAIKSEKPFKRPNYRRYIVINPKGLSPPQGTTGKVCIPTMIKDGKFPFIWENTKFPVILCISAILGEDWEIKK